MSNWTQEELDEKLAENDQLSVELGPPDPILQAYAKKIDREIMSFGKADKNTYHAKRTWSSLCNREFASKAEARHGEVLHLLEREGEISDLEYQVKYALSGDPLVTITIDFKYRETETGLVHYEDVKGERVTKIRRLKRPRVERDFKVKLAWLKQRYGIEVELIT